MSDEFLEERSRRVLTLTINRPDKLNSLSPEVMLRLGDTLNEHTGTDKVRCAVIRGVSDRALSSGYDIGRIPEGPAAAEGPRRSPLQYGLDTVMAYAAVGEISNVLRDVFGTYRPKGVV